MTHSFTEVVMRAVDLLVAGEHAELEALTSARRLKAQDMANAISQYGRVLVTPPDRAYEELDVVRIGNAPVPRWSVRMGLWTLEEGRSDLSVEVTVIETGKGYALKLDDVHVL